MDGREVLEHCPDGRDAKRWPQAATDGGEVVEPRAMGGREALAAGPLLRRKYWERARCMHAPQSAIAKWWKQTRDGQTRTPGAPRDRRDAKRWPQAATGGREVVEPRAMGGREALAAGPLLAARVFGARALLVDR